MFDIMYGVGMYVHVPIGDTVCSAVQHGGHVLLEVGAIPPPPLSSVLVRSTEYRYLAPSHFPRVGSLGGATQGVRGWRIRRDPGRCNLNRPRLLGPLKARRVNHTGD